MDNRGSDSDGDVDMLLTMVAEGSLPGVACDDIWDEEGEM